MKNETLNLLPCPFCGGAAFLHKIGNESLLAKTPKKCGWDIGCEKCRITIVSRLLHYGFEQILPRVVENWNKRAEPVRSEILDNEPLFHEIRMHTDLAGNFGNKMVVIPASQVMAMIDKHRPPKREAQPSEISDNEELLALRWKDWNQTIFLDRQYYRARTYRHILDNLAMEVNFHGDESTAAIVASARALMATVEKDAIAYADNKYKNEGRVKPTEAPKRESVEEVKP